LLDAGRHPHGEDYPGPCSSFSTYRALGEPVSPHYGSPPNPPLPLRIHRLASSSGSAVSVASVILAARDLQPDKKPAGSGARPVRVPCRDRLTSFLHFRGSTSGLFPPLGTVFLHPFVRCSLPISLRFRPRVLPSLSSPLSSYLHFHSSPYVPLDLGTADASAERRVALLSCYASCFVFLPSQLRSRIPGGHSSLRSLFNSDSFLDLATLSVPLSGLSWGVF